MKRLALSLLATMACWLVVFAFFAPLLSAATPAVPPPVATTVPCPGCGPSGKPPVGRNVAFAYPEHFCVIRGTKVFSSFDLVYGLLAGHQGPAHFRLTGTAPSVKTINIDLGIVNPGQIVRLPHFVEITPREVMRLVVTATNVDGSAAQFGNGTTSQVKTLICDCAPVPTTTTVVVVPPTVVTHPPTVTTLPPRVPSTTVPAPHHPARVVGSAPTTLPFLPATGSDLPFLLLVAGGLATGGVACLLVDRRRRV